MCFVEGIFLKKPENSPHKNDENDAETPPVQAKSLSDEIICLAKRSFLLLLVFSERCCYDEQFCSPSLSFFYDDELSFTFEHFFSPTTRTTPPRNKDDDDKKMETTIIDYY